jgi:AcrR family transcriptional regulator
MPQRDEQEYESRRQQIIGGALEVFASKGFEKATNKDIAQAARIGSPGLIYHYFKDKSDLLRQVIEQRAPVLQLIGHSDALMRMPPREMLTRFGTAMLGSLDNRETVSLFKIMLGEALRRPVVAEVFNAIGPSRDLGLLAEYLEQQMQAGVLRRIHPGAAARCFVGPLVAFVITREVFPQPDSTALSSEMMVASVVDIFLKGMEVAE